MFSSGLKKSTGHSHDILLDPYQFCNNEQCMLKQNLNVEFMCHEIHFANMYLFITL